MQQNDYRQKVIGANLSFKLKTSFDIYSFELLIDSKSRLIEFSINGVDSEFRDIIISKLLELSKKDLGKNLEASLSDDYTKNVHYKTYWFYISQKIIFFLNPIAEEILNCEDRICRCFNITRGDIEEIITKGAKDILTITNLTKAGGGCTSCISDIKALLGDNEEEENITEAESDIFSFTIVKREKILDMWPIEFLENEIFPLLSDFNQINSSNARVVQLVDKHLYVQSDKKIQPLEEFLKFNKIDLSLFYV